MTPLNHPLNIILFRKMKNIFTDYQEGSMNFSEVGWCNPERETMLQISFQRLKDREPFHILRINILICRNPDRPSYKNLGYGGFLDY